jgi:hypothetical protein|tara:strand:+ start:435 stop:740 length:306 start_codon:yes stop_codon:yes gene_type:complete
MYLDINVKRTKYSNGGNPIVQSKFMDVAHLDQRGTRVTFKLPVSKNITLSREIAKDRHSPSYTKNKLTFKKDWNNVNSLSASASKDMFGTRSANVTYTRRF